MEESISTKAETEVALTADATPQAGTPNEVNERRAGIKKSLRECTVDGRIVKDRGNRTTQEHR